MKRVLLFISLYLAQGLPYGFFLQALPVILRKNGTSLSLVGASSLLSLPWGIKFLWAPLVDRYGLAKIGLRRSWILPLQAMMAALFLLLIPFPPERFLLFVLAAVLLANLFAATQDIATDALAIDLLTSRQRGWAGGIKVGAYRVGMIIGGGVILHFSLRLGWSGVMTTLALVTLICTIPTIALKEPSSALLVRRATDLTSRGDGVGHLASRGKALRTYVQFFKREGVPVWVVILIAYKSAHYAATEMLRPWLVDQGYTLSDIADVLSTAGFTAGFLGAAVGGWLASRSERRRWLAPLAFLQMLGVASYLLPVKTAPQIWKIYFATSMDHFTSGVSNAFLFTLMMDACRPEMAATDYSLQSCLVVLATTLAAGLSGVSAQWLGYEGHFLVSAAIGLFSACLTLLLMRRSDVQGLLMRARGSGRPDLSRAPSPES